MSRNGRPSIFPSALKARSILWLLTALMPSSAAAQPPPPDSLTFESAVELATARNLSVEAARRQRAIREAAVRAARQTPNPEFSAEASRDTPHQAVSLDLPFELGGKRARRVDLANEELTLAELDVQAELRVMRREVRQAFYSVVAADERVRLAEGGLQIARRLHDAAEARFETGAAPRLEAQQAELGVVRAETELDLARGLRAASQATLNGLLNFAPENAVSIAGALADHTTTPSYERAISLASSSNTALATLDRQLAIEERRVVLLRAERMPTPVVSLGAVLNAPGEFNAGPRVAVSIGLPLFTRNQGEIAASLATTTQLRAEREATARTIQTAVFGSLARIEASRRQTLSYSERLVPAASALEALTEESYRAGRVSVLGVLEAQRSLRELRSEALQAALEMQFSLAELEELIGAPLP
jgi:cobalt-zinc-cadmium efflux system outer membrane protein